MEIAGYEIPDQYLIGGAGILLVGGFLLSRKGGETKEIAELRPAEGLTWQDIIGTSDEGKLIGPGGPLGDSGPPGAPGPQPNTPNNPPRRRKKKKDKERGLSGGRDRDRDSDRDRDNDDVSDRDRVRDREGNILSTRPRMPRERDDNEHITDPRLDRPKDRSRRNQARNRIDNGQSRRLNDRDERDRTRTPVRVNPRTGAIRNPDRDRTRGDRERDGRASANADGGTVRIGDVDTNADVNISVDGGREVERDRNRQRQERQRVRKAKGRAGYGIPGIQTDGYGRLDGRGTTASGYVRKNISPGSTTGSFMPGPQALTGRKDSLTIRRGETLKGLAKRAYGSSDFWPRVVTLNNDVILPEGEIPAGTKIRI